MDSARTFIPIADHPTGSVNAPCRRVRCPRIIDIGESLSDFQKAAWKPVFIPLPDNVALGINTTWLHIGQVRKRQIEAGELSLREDKTSVSVIRRTRVP